MMFLESSFVPFPSEIAMIPAGYLAFKGEMNLFLVIISGILGSLAGSLLNYYLALYVGREILLKYGRFVGFKEETMVKMERFFEVYGPISTFSGRLIPVVRQYISLPAGAGKMNLASFCLYTSLGAGIWVSILAIFGYYIGGITDSGLGFTEIIETFSSPSHKLTPKELELKSYVYWLMGISLGVVVLVLGLYILFHRKTK
uniref:DedA family protein n=1 Tax=Helicobacter sp. 15-1451 TaxID=2004995 RepID=UPI000DD41BC3|nr:DedA family protein [Helicobacter sp. 15-1451]